jgi:hypothetical protein
LKTVLLTLAVIAITAVTFFSLTPRCSSPQPAEEIIWTDRATCAAGDMRREPGRWN